MTPLFQNRYDGKKLNCFYTCLASILEIDCDIELTEKFKKEKLKEERGEKEFEYNSQIRIANDYLRSIGKFLEFIGNEEASTFKPSGWSIACGPTDGPQGHAVVAYNGNIVHDPSPYQRGINEIYEWFLIKNVKGDGNEKDN